MRAQPPVVVGAIGDEEALLGELARDLAVLRALAAFAGGDAGDGRQGGSVHAHVTIGENVIEHVLVLAHGLVRYQEPGEVHCGLRRGDEMARILKTACLNVKPKDMEWPSYFRALMS